jgi:predicted permease
MATLTSLLASLPARIRTRARALFHRDGVAGEIHDELEFHRDMRVEEYERAGLSPAAARQKARARIGNAAVHEDRGYDVRGGGVFETVVQDVRYAVRLLRRQPGFTLLAVITLALGIGAATALFSVIDAAVLRPLPFPHPEQLVEVTAVGTPDPKGRVSRTAPSLADVRVWQGLPTVTAAAMFRPSAPKAVVDSGGGPERLAISIMSEGLLDVCGMHPVIGRAFMQPDVAKGAAPVTLLGYHYWSRQFAGQADVLGKMVRFIDANAWSGAPATATIVGVLPEDFFPDIDLWRPTPLDERAVDKRGSGQTVLARLAPRVTTNDAAVAMLAGSRERVANAGDVASFRLDSWLDEVRSGYASTLNMLGSAVALVLVIGCINVAGLLFARGSARGAEFAIRASIGAGRGRIVRQLLTESAVLAALGCALGVFLAWLCLDALLPLVPLSVPESATVSINGVVLAFAVGLSGVTALLFGLVPAWSSSNVSLVVSMGSGGRHGSGFSTRAGQALIAVEVALAVVLLAASALLGKSLMVATSVDVGVDPDRFITLDVAPISQEPGVLTAYYRDLRARVRALPGVEAVGLSDSFPIGGRGFSQRFLWLDGARAVTASAISRDVRSGYVEALGQRVVRGRVPPESELAEAPALLINETAAAEWFPDEDALGRSVTLMPNQPATIVGITADVRQSGPLYKPDAEMLQLSKAAITGSMWVIIRPEPGAHVSTNDLRRIANDIGPAVFVEDIRSGADWAADRVASPRHRAALFGLLGGLGLVLTLVGTFGVTAFAVSRRAPEMAVRMAFGAAPAQVVRRVLAASAWPVVFGTATGLGFSFVATRVVAKFLFEVSPTDPSTFTVVAVLVAAAGVVAAWIPARRTSRVDPVQVLREVR